MRPIDADALKEAFEKIYPLSTNEMGGCVNKRIYELIDNAPTVPLPDFKEGYKQAILDGKTNFSRPQGEWEYVKMSSLGLQIARCTNCKDKAYGMTDYCPNCGADMRKGGAE